MTNKPSRVVVFAPTFRRSVKNLRKKYPRIQQDVQPLIERLAGGETPGNLVPSTGNAVYKVRLPNRDAQRGKSGGYRVMYYLQTKERIILLTMYAKSDQTDISAGTIQDLIADLPDDD